MSNFVNHTRFNSQHNWGTLVFSQQINTFKCIFIINIKSKDVRFLVMFHHSFDDPTQDLVHKYD